MNAAQHPRYLFDRIKNKKWSWFGCDFHASFVVSCIAFFLEIFLWVGLTEAFPNLQLIHDRLVFRAMVVVAGIGSFLAVFVFRRNPFVGSERRTFRYLCSWF